MNPKFLRFFILTFGMILMVITLKTCGFHPPSQLKVFKVGLNNWPGYQIALYAQDAGIFRQHGLDVEFIRFNNQQDNIRATMRGSQDASFAPLSEVIQVDSGSEKPAFFLVVDISAGSDGIAARPGIDSVQELKGKTVSAKFSTVSHLILLEALKANQLNPQDVNIVDVANEQGAEMLKQGKISGAVLWEPLLQDTAKAVGGKVIHTTADLDSMVIDGITTRSSLLKTKQDEMSRFIEGWFDAIDAVNTHPDVVFSSIAQKIGTTAEMFAEDYQGLLPGDREMNYRMFVDGRLPEVYQQIRQLLLADQRHRRIVRDDVDINAEPLLKAMKNWRL